MVFPSSVSAYLDHSNWQQQQASLHSLNQNGIGNNQVIFQQPDGGNYGGTAAGGGGTIAKRNSMAERARQAKVPQPESALKCPRCESTNTKFCYFNNYSLTQPRHFCKTCRRYWTSGGALRSVPVGGGCRRNKRSKSRARSSSSSAPGARSKSPIKTRTVSPLLFPNAHHDHNINLGQILAPHQLSTSHHGHLPLLPPLHHLGQLADYNNNNNNNNNNNFGGAIPPQNAEVAGGSMVEQWRSLQQLPFFANLENTTGMLYSSSNISRDQEINQGEGNDNNLLMSRNFLGSFSAPAAGDRREDDEDQQQRYCGGWGGKYMNGGGLWSGGDGLPGFTSSSSTSHLL